MSKINDGGPAFGHGNHEQGGHPGMSLRDWFAGQALASWPVTDRDGCASDLARKCYAQADAMLAERERQP